MKQQTRKNKIKPKLIIAGVHGDERTATKLLKGKNLKNSIIIANVNSSGYKKNSRYDKKGRDINRLFGKGIKINAKTRRIEKLIKEKKVSLVADFHESIGYYTDKNCRTKHGPCLGNSIIPAPQKSNKKLTSLVNKIIKNLKNMKSGKTFKIGKSNLKKKRGTLREFSQKHKIPYILIEIAKPQSVKLKKKQIKQILKTIALN